MNDPLETAKREQERTTQALLDAKRQLSAAMDAKAGPAAESVDQAQEQLHTIRAGLERDLESLKARVPDTDELVARVRPIAIAAGGGLATLFLASRGMSKRRARKRHETELREHATALAESFARLDLEAIAREAAAERAAAEQRGKGKLLGVVAFLIGVAAAAWFRARTREEPDLWGPDAEPIGGAPAAPTDATTEMPTIPIESR